MRWGDFHTSSPKLRIHEIIVGGPTRLRGIGDRELQVCRITVDQARIEITNHLLNGGRYMDAQLYSKALREFEDAEFKIVNLPESKSKFTAPIGA